MPTPEAIEVAKDIRQEWMRIALTEGKELALRHLTLMAEHLDRFAAQRGAEAAVLDRMFDAYVEGAHEGAPPQTGGGDAGERAREGIEALTELTRGDKAELLANLNAALRSSHREGAEAMRADCAQIAANCVGGAGIERSIRALPIPGKTE